MRSCIADLFSYISPKRRHCLQLKVKAVADSVWANLTGAYSNDIQHVQVGDANAAFKLHILSSLSFLVAVLQTCKSLAHSHPCGVCCSISTPSQISLTAERDRASANWTALG